MVRLRIQKLGKGYGNRQVLRDLSWEGGSSIVGISGPNGSGKSTLLQCMAGLLRPASGRIIWTLDGEEFAPAEKQGFAGLAAPYVELYEAMSVRENLLFFWQLDRNRSPSTRSRIPHLLNRFQVDDFADKLYGELSTGQRQRAKLAVATLHEPPVLLLDEPGANLDESGRLLIEELLQEYEQQGRMVILASNREEELRLCHDEIRLALQN